MAGGSGPAQGLTQGLAQGLGILGLEVLVEGLGDEQGQDEGGVRVDLDRLGVQRDLAPADGLIRASPAVTAVKLLGGVDVDGKVSSVAQQVGIANVVLGHTSSHEDHASLGGGAVHHGLVNQAHILHQVKPESGALEAVKHEHVTNGSVRECGAEDGDVVLPGPVRNAVLAAHLAAQAVDHLGGCPVDAVLLLLPVHVLQNGHDPLLKPAVVGVGDHHVADAVEALLAQILALEVEVPNVGVPQALDEVLLHPPGSGHDDVNHLVLDQVPDMLAGTSG
mmetsp:Transcript_37464/g.83373  ORF Transcript_37464/g.83373 Transcript_37464/m.83373 type:complete len:278 (-) Transcript_37464:453-1286(-)